jgi:hypothetical protein
MGAIGFVFEELVYPNASLGMQLKDHAESQKPKKNKNKKKKAKDDEAEAASATEAAPDDARDPGAPPPSQAEAAAPMDVSDAAPAGHEAAAGISAPPAKPGDPPPRPLLTAVCRSGRGTETLFAAGSPAVQAIEEGGNVISMDCGRNGISYTAFHVQQLRVDKHAQTAELKGRSLNKFISSQWWVERSGMRAGSQLNADIGWATDEELKALAAKAHKRAAALHPDDIEKRRRKMQSFLARGRKHLLRRALQSFVRLIAFTSAALHYATEGTMDGFAFEKIVILVGAQYEHARGRHKTQAFPCTQFIELLSTLFCVIIVDENFTSQTCLCGTPLPKNTCEKHVVFGKHTRTKGNKWYYTCPSCVVQTKTGPVSRVYDKDYLATQHFFKRVVCLQEFGEPPHSLTRSS